MKEELIKSVFDSRLLRTQEEFDTFEQGLAQLAQVADTEDIVKLYHIFDDNTEMEEVMWGLVHLIEGISSTQWCDDMLVGLVSTKERASEWGRLMAVRVLNHEPMRIELTKAYQNAEPKVREYAKKVFEEIVEENPQRFAEPVSQVLGKQVG